METGTMNERIKIFKPTGECKLTTLDDYEELVTVWANVRSVSTREQMRSNLEIQSGQITVMIRYRHGLSDDCLVYWNNRYYCINNLSVNSAKGEILLGCTLSGLNENVRIET